MDEEVWNIIPINDLEEHEESSMCKCKPEVREVDGGVLIIHNSFDGREGLEMANEILNG